MSHTVVVQETAIRALARIRPEDKDAFARIRAGDVSAGRSTASRCGSRMGRNRDLPFASSGYPDLV
jgi:hypothetical protein